MQNQDVIVLGAGIIGVSTALHLQARGRSVCLIDLKAPGEGTSYGNAGLIERSSVIPYSFPRDFASLIKYALNRQPDVRYDPLYLPKIAPWLLQFWRESSPERLKIATEAMLPLVEASVDEHDLLIKAAGCARLIRSKGWISAHPTQKHLDETIASLGSLDRFGLRYDILDRAEIHKREPSLGEVAGGIHWLDPKTVVDPGGLVKAYASLFEKNGGIFIKGDATTLTKTAKGWDVVSEAGPIRARDVVIALGPQADRIATKFGYKIPMAVKRGHHLHFDTKNGARLEHSIVDAEGGYVLAPMVQGVRLTTGIEFANPSAPANRIQLNRTEKLARKLMPQLGNAIESQPWLGLRPCLPDMRPVIGEAPRHKGLWFNFGHAHHGLTLGPVTGRLLAEMMTGEQPLTDPTPYSPRRFG